ncbi:G-type lectin S-receptor-like serine/threonine-protein kinase [Dorcoceras hygrometricum]|uniref:G-type lectin S-receptor-like serine/threonine-protein kinase n=1 Tax=Dorcoceras hygrometricum TaxID=472368 RepID=A0A2Z7D9S4_9LAMI|nr:G-type lectin S-receptor-like serine/threonine-protein kinase [Dorcoceras hygrometricum]
MSLFNLQDVCIVIGSLATLDLPMVVDLIGIYVLKGPYCTLTTTKWFLQALSVIPRGSWGDVARRFTMIHWASPKLRFRSLNGCGPTASCIPEPLRVTQEPGSDQFHKETGTSKARSDSPHQDDRNKSDHGGGGTRRWRGGARRRTVVSAVA